MNFSDSDPCPYEVLGLPKDAAEDLVRNTYKKLIKMYHPDIFEGDQDFAKEKDHFAKSCVRILRKL